MNFSVVKSRLYLVAFTLVFSAFLGVLNANAEVCFLPIVTRDGGCSGGNIGPGPNPNPNPVVECDYSSEAACKNRAGFDSVRSYCEKVDQCWERKTCAPKYNSENNCKTALQNDTEITAEQKGWYACTTQDEKCYGYGRKTCDASEGKYYTKDACETGGNECVFDSTDGCYKRVVCPGSELTESACATSIQGKENYQECIAGSEDGCYRVRDCESDKYISAAKCNSAKGENEYCQQIGQCWEKHTRTPPEDSDLTLYVYYTCDGGSCPTNMFDRALPQVDIYGTGEKTQFAHTSDSSYETGDGTPYSIFTFKQDDIINAFKDDKDCYGDDGNPCWMVASVPVVYTIPLSGKEVNTATLSWKYTGDSGEVKDGSYTPNWAWNGANQVSSLLTFESGPTSNVWDSVERKWVSKNEGFFEVNIDDVSYQLTNTKHSCGSRSNNECYKLASKILTLNVDLKTSENQNHRNCLYAAVNCSGSSLDVDTDYKDNCPKKDESGQDIVFTETDDYWGNNYQTKGLCAVLYNGTRAFYVLDNDNESISYKWGSESIGCATVKHVQSRTSHELEIVGKNTIVSPREDMDDMVEVINDVNHLSELKDFPDAKLYKTCGKSASGEFISSEIKKNGLLTNQLSMYPRSSTVDYVFSSPDLYNVPTGGIYQSGGNEAKPTSLIRGSYSNPIVYYNGVYDSQPLFDGLGRHFAQMAPVIHVSAEIKPYTNQYGSMYLPNHKAYEGECNCDEHGQGSANERYCSTTSNGYSREVVNMVVPSVIGPGSGDLGGGGTSVSFGADYGQFRLYLDASSSVMHTFGPFSMHTNYQWSAGDLGPSFTQQIANQVSNYLRINFNAANMYLYKGTKHALSMPNCLHTSISYDGHTWEHRVGQAPGASGDYSFGISSDPKFAINSWGGTPFCQRVENSPFYNKQLTISNGNTDHLYVCDYEEPVKAFYVFGKGFEQEE